MRLQPSASYSFTMRLRLPQQGNAFAAVAQAIAESAGMLGAIDLVRVERDAVVRDLTVACGDSGHAESVVRAVRAVDGVTVDSVSDRTFLLHKGGKIEIKPKLPIRTRDDLSMAYTPGVGRVSTAIHEDPSKAWTLTIKGNAVAVISDGTAVLGLGDIGPEAAMPVMSNTMVEVRINIRIAREQADGVGADAEEGALPQRHVAAVAGDDVQPRRADREDQREDDHVLVEEIVRREGVQQQRDPQEREHDPPRRARDQAPHTATSSRSRAPSSPCGRNSSTTKITT